MTDEPAIRQALALLENWLRNQPEAARAPRGPGSEALEDTVRLIRQEADRLRALLPPGDSQDRSRS